MSIVEILREAIESRNVLNIFYDPGSRQIEPHCLGRSSKGELLLRAFQVEGASSSGEHINWKLFRVDKLTFAKGTGNNFAGPRPQYNPNDKVMKGGIIASL